MLHKMLPLALAASLAAAPVLAEGLISHKTDQSFDDVVFGLENAIVGEGLVIDATSKVGDMLERTREDVGSDKVIFENAQVFSFCSAALSRKVMEADPMNIGYCPYNIFVARMDGAEETIIGYRAFPEGEMKEVEEMLERIAREAIGM